jgi:hypothetical protein
VASVLVSRGLLGGARGGGCLCSSLSLANPGSSSDGLKVLPQFGHVAGTTVPTSSLSPALRLGDPRLRGSRSLVLHPQALQ